ncbi:hypothetical protein PCYB_061140 [Plasmodium cynomolgi strain B]|uniref:Rhoptry neck protein 12 n=1 Tax=Plasmodium cynomolgi (strain B) TaxID=1120755 RepID=K6V8A5_PLACD|nr:hypothetical protein PCYB_061140 [Plasmodium cynomolgi strain B]GAB65382.1 hypothetical protein PCYB_061140 [Plasmodium cynomolgi strain B]
MRYLKRCKIFCCVYLLVAGIGTLALRKTKVDGGAIGIQGKAKGGDMQKANGEDVKKNGTESNQTTANACSGNYNKSDEWGGCPVDASTAGGVEQKEKKQNEEKVQNVETVQNEASNGKSFLDSVVIPEDAFESAKNLCEFVVIKSKQFKEFCKQSIFFKEIQLLKQKDPKLYAQITGESYENEATSSFQVLKDEGDRKIVDNVFDVNQSAQLGGGNADVAEADDMEGEITGEAEEGSQGTSESITDLTEEGS